MKRMMIADLWLMGINNAAAAVVIKAWS